VTLNSPLAGDFMIYLSKLEKIIGKLEVLDFSGSKTFVISKDEEMAKRCFGVLRVTIIDRKSKLPIAERLIFRHPQRHLR